METQGKTGVMDILKYGSTENEACVMSPNKSRQRTIWLRTGLVTSSILILMAVILIGFEIVTGRLSGTVVQATITGYAIGPDGLGKLNIQGCRLSSTKFDLHLDAVPVAQSGESSLRRMSSVLAWCRRLAWKEATFGPSMAFALDKPTSVQPLISPGEVLSLCPGESVVLLTYETNYATERLAVTLRCDPLPPPIVSPISGVIP